MTDTLPTYDATRYVVPLREGGSLPAVVETDGGTFVVKFRGAGQGAKVLVAEIIVGALAEAAGLPMPDVALVTLDASFGRTERDPEIQDILKASVGLNVGLRFLEGAFGYDALASTHFVTPNLAAEIVWLDGFTFNLDRTVRNPNLLVAEGKLWLIDHGAALYFHHNWDAVDETRARAPFAPIEKHVLLPLAGDLRAADARMRARLTPEAVERALACVPDALLLDAPPTQPLPFETAEEARAAYRSVLLPRLADPAPFVDAAVRAQAVLAATPPTALPYRR